MLRYYLITHGLAVATFALSVVVAGHALQVKREPSVTLAWLLAIAFVPYLGIPLYFMLAGRKMRRRKRVICEQKPTTTSWPESDDVATVLAQSGVAPPSGGNHLEFAASGEDAYGRLLRLIGGARETVHVTMFILGRDPVGEKILDALVERANEGVDVRLILDAVGSAKMVRRAKRLLHPVGGHVAVFMPLVHMPFRGRVNLRNHRKLVIADGARLMTDGMNLAEEYLGPSPKPGVRWRDLAVFVEGPAVQQAETLFASDWEFAAGRPPSVIAPTFGERGAATLQFVASGPDVPTDAFYNAVVTGVFAARNRVRIVTPYFVPDRMLQRALVLAARRQLGLEIVVPDRSNHALADYARVALLSELQAAGARVLYYPEMLHAKLLVLDDMAIMGSPNLDMRSLFLNYESALCARSAAEVKAANQWIDALQLNCSATIAQPRPAGTLFEPLARLLSPQL